VREFVIILISGGSPIKSCKLKGPRDDLGHFSTTVARALAWAGILAIIVLSVVPADDRPVTGIGQLFEHLTAYALVAGVFSIGYRFSLSWTLLLAFLFCGGIELFQVPLPTRHARVSDFIIDFVGSCFAIALVFAGDKLVNGHRRNTRSPMKH
jgi:VanZ family protein